VGQKIGLKLRKNINFGKLDKNLIKTKGSGGKVDKLR